MMGLSARTVYRDVVDLSNIVPVYCDKGYRLLTESYIAKLSFTHDELLALKLAVRMPALSQASHLAGAAKSALSKIDEQLTIRRGRTTAGAADPISYDVAANPVTAKTIRTLRLLEEAVLEQRVVILKYHSTTENRTKTREVDPYGLTFRRRSWYLVGHCRLRDAQRVFRVDRIQLVTVTKKRFERPPGFSLASFFKDSWEVYAPGEIVKARIRFSSFLADTVKPQLEGRGRFRTARDRKTITFEGEVPTSEEFVRWLLTFGSDAKVLAPLSLGQRVAHKALAIANLYPRPNETPGVVASPQKKRRKPAAARRPPTPRP